MPENRQRPGGWETAATQKRWMVSFRFGVLAGKIALILLSIFMFGAVLPLVAIGALLGVELASNLALWRLADPRRRELSWFAALVVLGLDCVMLTALLHLTGGAANPFSFVALVYVTVAAVTLPVAWAWGLALFTTAAFGTLFLVPGGGHHGHHAMALHLYGMWLAYAVAAVFIVFFVHRLRWVLARQQRRLAHAERLAAVTTLAAGAAHELSTPLGTIALAAGELEESLARLPSGGEECPRGEIAGDVALIRSQVTRCKAVLDGLHLDAGAPLGESPRPISLDALLEPLVEVHPSLGVRVAPGLAGREVELPAVAVRRAIGSLVDNAYEALHGDSGAVSLSVREVDGGIAFLVEDRGCGMNEHELEQACDPFISGKAPGQGMGLGLFLARTVAEQLGGSLVLDSTPGEGTTATFEVIARQCSAGGRTGEQEGAP